MNKPTKILATVIACLALAGTCLADTKTTYRDAQGRLQGLVVSLMPVILCVIMTMMKPNLMIPFLTSLSGIACLLVASVMVFVGWLVIRKIVTIKV